MGSLPYVVALLGLAVLLYTWWRTRTGASPLGPRVEGELHDTRREFALAFTVWLLSPVLLSTLLPPGTAPPLAVLAGKALQATVALLFLRAALAGPRPVLEPRRRVLVGVGAALVAFALTGITTVALSAVYEMIDVDVPSQTAADLVRHADGVGLAALVVAAVALAPFAEEVIFRGLLLPVLARWMPIRRAIVVQAVIFGLLHFLFEPSKWPLAIPIAVIGCIAGWVYVRTASLRAVVALHAVYNAIQIALILLG